MGPMLINSFATRHVASRGIRLSGAFTLRHLSGDTADTADMARTQRAAVRDGSSLGGPGLCFPFYVVIVSPVLLRALSHTLSP